MTFNTKQKKAIIKFLGKHKRSHLAKAFLNKKKKAEVSKYLISRHIQNCGKEKA
jgi:hypothetical protein